MQLSESAKSGLQKVAEQSLRTSVDQVYQGQYLILQRDLEHVKRERIYMITISGLSFKLIGVLHISDCELSREIARENLKKDSDLEDADLSDFFQEMTNSCFGVTKRMLGDSFNHLGMSTPQLLSSDARVLDIFDLEPDYHGHISTVIDEQNIFAISFFVNCQTAIEVVINRVEEKSGSGETKFKLKTKTTL